MDRQLKKWWCGL